MKKITKKVCMISVFASLFIGACLPLTSCSSSTDSTSTKQSDNNENEKLFSFSLQSDGTYAISKGELFDSLDASSLKEITIPSKYQGKNVAMIMPKAFGGCEYLTNVSIPDSIISIGDRAFSGCTNLTSITIPDSVKYIGKRAFSGCTNLKNAVLSNALEYIDEYTFSQCTSLTMVTIPNSVTQIQQYAFSDSGLVTITIPESVTYLDYRAFNRCKSLAEVIGNLHGKDMQGFDNVLNFKASGTSDVVNKDDYLFLTSAKDNTNYLLKYTGDDTEVVLPESYNDEDYEIFQYAFYENTKIANVTISDTVTSIGKFAFYGCINLANVEFGNKVKEIGDEAFENCSELITITIPNNVKYFGKDIFKDCFYLAEIINFATTSSLGAPNVINNNYVVDDEMQSEIVNKDGYLFLTSAKDNVNYLIKYIGDDTELVLPESYNGENYALHDYVFYNQNKIATINIPSDIESIHLYENIPAHAFLGCDNLTMLVIPSSVISMSAGTESIGGCSSIEYVYYQGSPLEWNVITGTSKINSSVIMIKYYSEAKPVDATYKYWHYVNDEIVPW